MKKQNKDFFCFFVEVVAEKTQLRKRGDTVELCDCVGFIISEDDETMNRRVRTRFESSTLSFSYTTKPETASTIRCFIVHL